MMIWVLGFVWVMKRTTVTWTMMRWGMILWGGWTCTLTATWIRWILRRRLWRDWQRLQAAHRLPGPRQRKVPDTGGHGIICGWRVLADCHTPPRCSTL